MQRRGSADTFLRAMVQHRNSERLKGLVDAKLDELISRRIQVEDVNDAFEKMKAGAVARSVIVFD